MHTIVKVPEVRVSAPHAPSATGASSDVVTRAGTSEGQRLPHSSRRKLVQMSAVCLALPATVVALRHLDAPLGRTSASLNQALTSAGAVAAAWSMGSRATNRNTALTQQSLAAAASCISIGAALVSHMQSSHAKTLSGDASAASINLCIFSQAMRFDVGRKKATAIGAQWHDKVGRYIPHAIVASSLVYILARMEMHNRASDRFVWETSGAGQPLLRTAVHCSQPAIAAIVFPLMLKQLVSPRAARAHASNRVAGVVIAAAFLLVAHNLLYAIKRTQQDAWSIQ